MTPEANAEAVRGALLNSLSARDIIRVISLAIDGWPEDSDDDEGIRYALQETCGAALAKLESALEHIDKLEAAAMHARVDGRKGQQDASSGDG